MASTCVGDLKDLAGGFLGICIFAVSGVFHALCPARLSQGPESLGLGVPIEFLELKRALELNEAGDPAFSRFRQH